MIQDVESRVKQVISNLLQVQPDMASDASFIEDLGADSLDIVEMIMALEEHFNLSIPEEDAEKIQTVQDAINYVARHLS